MNDRPDSTEPASRAGQLASAAPWTFVAEGYDGATKPYLEAFSRSAIDRMHLGPEADVIDIACGPGTTALTMSPKVRRIACVDFAIGMLEQLRRNAERAGLTNIEPCLADGQALPFRSESFDIGVSMFGLMFFPDRRKGFAELHRVLRPEGEAVVSSWAPVEQSQMMRLVVKAIGGSPAKSPPAAPGLEDPAVLEREMRQAGFLDVRVEAISHAMTVTSIGAFWGDMVRGTVPIALMKHEQNPNEWAQVEATALERIAAALPELPAKLSSTAYLALGRKP